MPKKGQYASECKRGHDLTRPGARLSVGPTGRGAGGCKQCLVDKTRTRRGSTKTGPSSRYKGDEVARRAALAAGLKRCPECEQAKPPDAFWNDTRTADGKGCYCIECASTQKRADYYARRAELNLRARARKFGIEVDELRELIAKQAGLCAICQSVCISGRELAVDHDHATGRVRGLLCANCNRGLGLFKDSPDLLLSAVSYLST